MTDQKSIDDFKAQYEDCILRETPMKGKLASTGFVGWSDDKGTPGHICD